MNKPNGPVIIHTPCKEATFILDWFKDKELESIKEISIDVRESGSVSVSIKFD